jgi:predicted nucleotidyltransferase
MDKVDKVVKCLMQYEPEKIIIFGSYVRDEMDEYSNLDFVVIKKKREEN